MNIEKCRTCKHYNSFFGSCDLYYKEVYLGEGDFDVQPVRVKNISSEECEYESESEG